MSRPKSTDIYCANCLHCKVFTHVSEGNGARERRVRCAAGQWVTSAGNEKNYSLHTVLSRRKDKCAQYDSMGEEDLREFIKDLEENLPVERIIVTPNEPASGREVRI